MRVVHQILCQLLASLPLQQVLHAVCLQLSLETLLVDERTCHQLECVQVENLDL